MKLLTIALLGLLCVVTHANTTADLLFSSQPGVKSDRAAGIGKRVKPGAALVLADVRGPAVLRHFWMTNVRQVEPAIASGRVSMRFFWDDHVEPDLVVPLNEFFGTRFTNSNDLVFTIGLGKNAYYVMPFRRAARVELHNASDLELWGVYWQIDYDVVPRLPPGAEYFTARTRVASPPALNETAGDRRIDAGRGTVPAGTAITVATREGPAVIRRFALRCPVEAARDPVLLNRGVIVRMFWDGEEHPSVEAPLGDFFGTGFGEVRTFTSGAWAQGADGRREIRFPMPFRRSVRIELENLGPDAIGPLSWELEYEPQDAGFAAEDVEYFHASFRMSRPVPLNSTHPAMEAVGRGKFAGLVWSCHWLNGEQKPEGTQNFWVDGRRIQSTGSEDYFGRAWGFGTEPECRSYKGISLGPEPSVSRDVPPEWRRVTAYRAHILDPIRFEQSLRLDFTCYGYNRGHRTDEYATVCFWYQSEPHAPHVPLPPVEDLLPLDHPAAFGFTMNQIAGAEQERDLPRALAAAETLLRKYPRNPKAVDVQFKRGCLLEELGRRRDAVEVFAALEREHPASEVADAADKLWLLVQPGRVLVKAAAPAGAELFIDGRKVEVPASELRDVPTWGRAEIHRFTYPPFHVAWDAPSSAIMRLPALRFQAGSGRHVIAVQASAAQAGPIFTPRVGYFFATLDLAGPDVVTDATWKVSDVEAPRWREPDFDDRDWRPATVHALSRFGDNAWTWLWPRGFRLFSGAMGRIWTPAIYREETGFRETVYLRRTFDVPR